jgi:mannose-1-phosphate guanylyltransferase
MNNYQAVIMAGGSGTRFWPLSRKARPKQLLPILGGVSLLHDTVERLFPMFTPDQIYVVVGKQYVETVRDSLPMLPAENVLEEPIGRDTAPCVGFSAAYMEWRHPGSTFCILPADHFVGEKEKFHDALRGGYEQAQSDALVTFGVPPRYAATGYGYLERGVEDRVARFCEKPDRATAETFVSSGKHYWNSGIFVWKAKTILGEIETHLPDHFKGLNTIADSFGTDRFTTTYLDEFTKMEKISIDYGVMEKADKVVMIEADFDWDDVGSWKAAAARRPTETEGLVECIDTEDSLVISTEDHLVATLGVKGLVVVHTPDATLIVPKEDSEGLKKLIEKLRERKLDRVL